ncbi:MAG: hypothetical protein ACFB21_12750, partial [Opitutales bacterium]
MLPAVSTRSVLICQCASHRRIDAEELERVRASLGAAADTSVAIVDDLCRAAVERPEEVRQAFESETVFIACHARTRRALARRTGARTTTDSTFHNLRKRSADTVLTDLEVAVITEAREISEAPPSASTTRWEGWYPLIDYDACTHCKQCVSFCLFEVYGVDEAGRVTVENPEACKPNCPACARVCPKAAIIFPKFEGGPVAGEPVTED